MPRKPRLPTIDPVIEGLSTGIVSVQPTKPFPDDFTGEMVQPKARPKINPRLLLGAEELRGYQRQRAADRYAREQISMAKALTKVITDMLDPPPPSGPLKRRF